MERLVNSIDAGRITAFFVARKVVKIAKAYEVERILFYKFRTNLQLIYGGQIIDDEPLLFNEHGNETFIKTLDKLCGAHQTKQVEDELVFYWKL